ncbi:MAG: manganese efflux pump MntP [Planctomycetota bacterium]
MGPFETVAVALGLAMDAFAVAVAASITLDRLTPRRIFRLAFHFGLFQAMMPVLGWAAGLTVAAWITAWDHWVAFGLLTLIGVKAIAGAFRRRKESPGDPTRGWSLVILSVATSIDALAVGISLAMLDVRIWYPCAIIGVVAAAMTILGMALGRRLGGRFGKGAELLGGAILIGIGVKILVEHLAG